MIAQDLSKNEKEPEMTGQNEMPLEEVHEKEVQTKTAEDEDDKEFKTNDGQVVSSEKKGPSTKPFSTKILRSYTLDEKNIDSADGITEKTGQKMKKKKFVSQMSEFDQDRSDELVDKKVLSNEDFDNVHLEALDAVQDPNMSEHDLQRQNSR